MGKIGTDFSRCPGHVMWPPSLK